MSSDLRVLYISAKRGVETSLLEYLTKKKGGFSFIHFKLHLRSMNLKTYIKTLGQVIDSMKQYKPSIILLEGSGISSMALIPVKYFYRIPLAVRVKGDLWAECYNINPSMRPRELIRKFVNFAAAFLVLKSADLIIPISKKIEQRVRDKVGGNKIIKMVYIPYKMIVDESASQAPYENRKKNILTVTNFNFWGKVAPLADAVKNFTISLEKRGFSWIILGDGFFFNKFRDSIKDQIALGTIQLLGRQDPISFYKEAKALFYISGMDGLPNVVLEASMHYLPIFINDDCPAIEFVKHGVNGIIVSFKDPSQVAGALDMIQDREIEMGRLAASAYSYVTQTFSVNKVSGDLLAALRQCVVSKDQS